MMKVKSSLLHAVLIKSLLNMFVCICDGGAQV